MDKEVLKIELNLEMERMVIINEVLDAILKNNKWSIRDGKIVFENEVAGKVYSNSIKAYRESNEKFNSLEEECRRLKLYDIIKDIVVEKIEKGIL